MVRATRNERRSAVGDQVEVGGGIGSGLIPVNEGRGAIA